MSIQKERSSFLGLNSFGQTKSLRLCLVLRKFEGKWQVKKIRRKIRRKEKMKENKNKVKLDILFLISTSNSFYFNLSI